MQDYAGQLQRVAYLLSEDVERLVEGQALSTSMAVIANKRCYNELCVHLRTGE